MKFYYEIQFKDTEISTNFIWRNLYRHVHLALLSTKDEKGIIRAGLSFPEYNKERDDWDKADYEDKIGKLRPPTSLGKKLRIFAENEDTLYKLDMNSRLAGLEDYLDLKQEIREVGKNISGYQIFSRKQALKSIDSLVRRMVKKGIKNNENQAIEHCKNYYERETNKEKIQNAKILLKNLPFVIMHSQSSGRKFSLFVEQKTIAKEVYVENADYSFDCYGLSNRFALPKF
jgi:CRISPR-associated endoribonuclease Cas6/Csy4 subtype I-F